MSINEIKNITGENEWNIRRVLWKLTAAGKIDFTPGFKSVLLRNN